MVDTVERESDHTLLLHTETEIIETTAQHPFYTPEGWKDASELQAGDKIRTRENRELEIKETQFSYKPKKVYNFEVANWHTYFVGMLAWLVHNAKGKCMSTYIKGLVGNKPLRELTHNEIYNAFKNAGIDLSNHAIKRLKDIRTKALGFETPNDIMKIFNNGTRTVTDRAIEQSYGGLTAVISKETGKIITITP